MFVELAGKEILVVGGGRIAARRVRVLADFGCRITVLAPEIGEEMEKLLEDGAVSYIKEVYRPEFLVNGFWRTGGPAGAKTADGGPAGDEPAGRCGETPFFVLAAATADVNAAVAADCRKAGIPVNDGAKKENCDFYFPGIVKEKDAVVGVTSGGGDHKLAAALSKVVREFVDGWSADQ